MTRNAYYVTTAIAYPNGEPHIGHAYEMIATDAIARWRRLEGRDVFFLTGTDEHGIKMAQTAQREGLAVKALADRNSARFRDLAKAFDISNTDFIRTTEARHYKSSQELWRRMTAANNGDIYQETYKGWYSVRDEAYFDESEVSEGEGGKKLAPSGAEVTWVEEPSYFFRLSAYQERLLKLYEEQPDFIAPKERRNEIISFVKGGLQDVSISRTTFDWGIPVPGAPGHVMYVWIDALTNYITGVGFPDEGAANWRYWLPNETWKATSARHFRPIVVWLHTSEWLALAFIALATISAFLDYPLILRVSGIAIAIAAAFCLVVYLVRRDRMTRRVLEALHVVADRERRQRLTREYQQYLRAAS